MGSGSRGRQPAARRSGSRLRTTLAVVGAMACVIGSTAGSVPLDAMAAPLHGPAGSVEPGSTTTASSAALVRIRPGAAPTLAVELASLLAQHGARWADRSPSWVGTVAPQGADRGTQAARRLSTEALGDAAPSTIAASALGIPGMVLQAYRDAAADLALTAPSCGVQWWLLAGIGRIESGHASGGRVDAHGTTLGRILGPRLDGSLAGNAVIHDTDGGVFDGDPRFDRAVGPMQFLPSTWAGVRSDGNGDGVDDPNNVYDATLGAARYLCAGGADLRTPAGLASAVLRYNHSMAYVRSVLTWGQAYRDGVAPVAAAPGRVPSAADPRQAPDPPPQTNDRPSPSTTVRAMTVQPTKHAGPATTKDSPPVGAEGPPPAAAPDEPTSPTSGTPQPSSTLPPTGTPTTAPPTGTPTGTATTAPPTTGPPTTGPPTTTPPTTGTPAEPQPAAVDPGSVWTLAPVPPAGDPQGRGGTLLTPGGAYSVTASLAADATLTEDGTPVRAADGQRFWVVTVQRTTTGTDVTDPQDLPSRFTLTVGGTSTTLDTVQLRGAEPVHLAASVATTGAEVRFTASTGYVDQGIDPVTGATTTTWTGAVVNAAAAGPPQLVGATSLPVEGSTYRAELSTLALGQVRATPWDPARGAAPDGQVWLEVPYALTAAITPDGFEQSQWLPPAVTVGDLALDPSVLAPLQEGQHTLVVPVAVARPATVSIMPRVQVVVGDQAADPQQVATFEQLRFTTTTIGPPDERAGSG